MTRVDFYILPDNATPQRFACSIAGKAQQQGHDIYIYTTSRDEAIKLDDLLWTFKDISFLPHTLVDDPDVGSTPISIGWPGAKIHPTQVLINLTDTVPDFIGDYPRIVEFVSGETTQKQKARERYRHYRDSGYDLHNHDLE